MLGVDGCPGGWVGALVPVSPADGVEWRRLADAAAVVAARAAAVGVDIPVGLPEAGPRACDVAARRRLRRCGSRVFPAPVRAVLAARSYPEACAISRAASGKALSRQTWNIVGKIREFDTVLSPDLQARVVEVHPEVSFALLAGTPLAPKRTAAGRDQRRAAVQTWLPGVELPGWARPDDALDALAAAWSARRWLAGHAEVLPSADPPRDARGLRMEIVV